MSERDRLDGAAPRRRRMDRVARREHLLDVAATVLSTERLDTVNIDHIADQAGVSRALVYEYFGDRASLVDEVRRRFAREFQTLLDVATERAPSANDLLVEFVATHLRYASGGAGRYRLATQDQEHRVAWLARYFGGTSDSLVVAAAAAESLRAFALTWADSADVSVERATELIVAYLSGGLAAVRPFGVKAPPRQAFPVSRERPARSAS